MINVCIVEGTRLGSKKDLDLNLSSSTFLLLQNFNNLHNVFQPQFIQLKNRLNNVCLAELLEGLTSLCKSLSKALKHTMKATEIPFLVNIRTIIVLLWTPLINQKLCRTCHLNSLGLILIILCVINI